MKILFLCAGRSTRDGLVKKDIERCRMLVQRLRDEIGRAVFTVGDTPGASVTVSTLISLGMGVRVVEEEFAWRMYLRREVQALSAECTSQILVLREEEYIAAREWYVSTLHWATVGDVVRPGPLVGSLVDTDGRTVEFIDPDKHR